MKTSYIGMMCGTSLDGIDIAQVSIDIDGMPEIVRFEFSSFDPKLVHELKSFLEKERKTSAEFLHWHMRLGDCFAQALIHFLRESQVQVKAVGFHGVTLQHSPNDSFPGSFQLGDPNTIHQKTGLPITFDFRAADMLNGGQGAPLVPYLDKILAPKDQECLFINLGGIANVTFLFGNNQDEVIASDSGPANMIMDGIISQASNGKQHFDCNGELTAKGKVNHELLNTCLSHPYFKEPLPKSTGREIFGKGFWQRFDVCGSLQDKLATACQLSVESLARTIESVAEQHKVDFKVAYVSGGGLQNPAFMEKLEQRLPKISFQSTQVLGMDPNAKEGTLIAMLARAFEQKIPGNVPSATGAKKAVVLGAGIGF